MSTPLQSPEPKTQVVRQWFQSQLAQRLLQAGNMAEDRRLLRRGARKQQDGVLGTQSPDDEEIEMEPEMQIRVGDEVHHHVTTEAPEQKNGLASTLSKLAPYLLAAGLGGGVGSLPWLLSDAPAVPAQPPAVTSQLEDTDTTRRIEFEVWRPETQLESER